MKRRIAAAAMVAALATAPLAWGQDVGTAPYSATSLSVSAFGEAKLRPDMATLTLGVETAAPTAQAAMTANAEQMSQVISAVKASGVVARDIQTSQLSLSPQYAYEQGKAPRLTGYQASNQVIVTESDLSRLGRLIDAVVAAGATNVGQVEFGLTNPLAVENSARVAAVKALEDKAELYAQAAGYRIGRLVSLSEGGGYEPSPPRPMMALAAKSVAPTPVEAGAVAVRIDVNGLFELIK